MITEADNLQERSDDRATWLWSILVSSVINLLAAVLVAWGISLRMAAIQVAQQRPEETFRVSSSSIHIAAQDHPIPQQANPQPVVAAKSKSHQRQPKAAQHEAATPQPTAQPTEIARIVPRAPPQPPPAPKKQNAGSLAEQLAQQQVAFQHETQQLNAHNAPLSVATIDPEQRESATRQYRINFSGNSGPQSRGEGYYIPLRAWTDNGLHCYYIEYTWLYASGGTEVGDVPWPFCYPPTNDPIARHERTIKILEPRAGYHLPPGTQLYPIEKEVYEYWLAHPG